MIVTPAYEPGSAFLLDWIEQKRRMPDQVWHDGILR
jgi:hypothetical protein